MRSRVSFVRDDARKQHRLSSSHHHVLRQSSSDHSAHSRTSPALKYGRSTTKQEPMTPSRTSHRSRSLALSTLNRIRSTTFDCTGTSQRMQQKKYGRLIPGRGNLGAVKIALTIAGGNVWLVGGSRSALGSGVQGKEEGQLRFQG